MVKAAEEDWTRSERIQLELSRTCSLCLGITRHLRDKPHALFVWQPSAAESCKKIGRWRRKIDVSTSARRRHFNASNWRAPKKNSSSSSNVSGQGESTLRRTCKWKSQHPSRPGYFSTRFWHGMARKDKSESFHMARASLENSCSELWRSKVGVEQLVWKVIRQGSAEEEVRKHRDRGTGARKQISK